MSLKERKPRAIKIMMFAAVGGSEWGRRGKRKFLLDHFHYYMIDIAKWERVDAFLQFVKTSKNNLGDACLLSQTLFIACRE